MNDKQRLDWLQKNQMSLISDDGGHWACTQNGMQNVPKSFPGDISTSFFVTKKEWHKTIRKAIDAAIKEDSIA